MDIREGYYRLQTEKFKARLQNIRAIITVYNELTNKNPVLFAMLGQYLSTYNEIGQFYNIIIKSQDDIDYYVKLINDFENALKAGYQAISIIDPHIQTVLKSKKLVDLFQTT